MTYRVGIVCDNWEDESASVIKDVEGVDHEWHGSALVLYGEAVEIAINEDCVDLLINEVFGKED